MVDSSSNHARDHARTSRDDPEPRLRLRFALYAGAVLLAAGVAIFWAVNREVVRRAEGTLETQARAVAENSLSGHLQPSLILVVLMGPRDTCIRTHR